MAKSVVKPVFSLHPLPIIFTPKPLFFVPFGHFWGKNHLFRGVFLFSSRDFLARNLCFRRKNQFDGEFFRPKHPKFNFWRRGKRGKQAFFHLTTDGAISKRGRFCPNTSTRTKKHKAITGKPKDKSKSKRTTQKRPSTIEQDKLFSSPLPHSTQKIQADFLSKLLYFSRLPPWFLSKPPYPAQNPFHPTRRTRAYAYIRARALSEFTFFAFTLHISPQQTVDQSVKCEGKPCIHLHLHRNNLKNNTLHDIRCKKSVKAKG